MLVNKHCQPLNSLANFQYYGHNELPNSVKDVFAKVSMFDLMLVLQARATHLTHLFSKKKNSPLFGTKPCKSQHYCRGNVAISPQDSVHLHECLLPSPDEIKECLCALFVGSEVVSTHKILGTLIQSW